MGIEIRTATLEDATAACAVLRRSITQLCALDHQNQPAMLESWLGNKNPQTVAAWIASPSNYTAVAVRVGEVVGIGLITQAGKLSLCYLLPEVRHAGVGKALLLALEQQALAWGVSVLKMHSTATARPFFESRGYVSAGKEKSCYGLECDFLWKRLDAEAAGAAATGKRFCNCGP